MDLLSTWIATPTLLLEGNPVAKWIGWRGGMGFNAFLSVGIAMWPLPAIIVIVVSVLVAARNFQSAWMMRSMGEAAYATWIHERLATTSPGLFIFCIVAQSCLTASVGVAIMLFTPAESIAFAIGSGILSYGAAVLGFSLFSLWRIRRA